ncbi:MAG: hypothetical protein JNL58_01335 [Planctomyces sp.]|nr:hypothetical protein [Planctomyces sp.]
MHIELRTFSGLKCRILESDGARPGTSRLLVILNHGFGAPGDDLVDIGGWLSESNDQLGEQCTFVFPAAPVDLGPMGMPGGRAWWQINMARLAEINQTKDFGELTNLKPDGLLEASQQLAEAIRELQRTYGVTDSRTVLGGFSQGAMVSTDVTLRHGIQPALLLLFSGTLICRDEWRKLAAHHEGCKVFQSHGLYDPILPFSPAKELEALLRESGFPIEFMEFAGQHTIPVTALQKSSQLLSALLTQNSGLD